jgi:uncharacterized membrane protein
LLPHAQHESPRSCSRHGAKLPLALIAHGAAASYAVTFTTGKWQLALFHGSFGVSEVYYLVQRPQPETLEALH